MTTTLVVITDGRPFLPDTLAAADQYLPEFDHRIIVDDSGTRAGAPWYDQFDQVVTHDTRRGLGAAVVSAWSAARGADYVFHLEDDFAFFEPVPIDRMRWLLNKDRTLAQVVLRRDPVYPIEPDGGYIAQDPDAYTQFSALNGAHWLRSRKVFSLNPCLIPAWVFDVTAGGTEQQITDALVADPDVGFAILGRRDDPPRVRHVGVYRSAGWQV